ncbi:MAG: CDP-diacylglycerol--glycerol-3-phosphate 3-phosphatidyltransferase [Clostridia bacterium]|nr:CDP-diacylglycerol--glycerol-3-phosphate 3-phosphatidyltransferase [Clostridia bacterium]
MNLANKLTILRIILVPIFVIVGYLAIPTELFGIPLIFIIMDIIFIIASITDKLDGYIARSRNQVTTFGKFLDPLADKILVLSALVMLVGFEKIPAWIPIIVLAREFLVSGYRLLAASKGGKVIAASIWGKVKTATQMVAIILIFVDRYSFGDFLFGEIRIDMSTFSLIFNIITTVLLTISTVATIFSGYDYLKNGKDLLKD